MAAGAAIEMGYTNLMLFQGGWPDWIGKGYPVKTGPQSGKFSGK
jgi:rhodanese-related sulfurtransferase